MVNYCCAPGCKTEYNPVKTISFHRFPFKRPEVLPLWIEAVGRDENWYPSKFTTLCGEHFLSSDYLNTPGSTIRILKPDAVPSVFAHTKDLISELNRHCETIKLNTKQKSENNIFCEEESMDISSESNSAHCSVGQISLRMDQYTQTVLDDKVPFLRRKIKALTQKLKRQDIKISKMKSIIKALPTKENTDKQIGTLLGKHFEGLPLELIMLIIHKERGKNFGQHGYSPLMKDFTESLYLRSPSAYEFIREYLALPNARTIRRWISGEESNCESKNGEEILKIEIVTD